MDPASDPATFVRGRPHALARWLLFVAALVFAMVVVGGITRLTESGLSITEWKPVSGAIPPLNAADWQEAFDLYRATPEFREINGPAGMDLAAFKVIFFWEWLHRLLGRVVGLALWFLNFSTWRGTHGIYLEDLYVQPGQRGRGLGRELLRTLAAVCVARGYSRLEWSVLDWNTPSIDFYRAAGAVPMDDWTVFRLTDDALTTFAAPR